jgi:hypothetical protein
MQVDFEKCKNGNIGQDCLMSINGTDFRIPQTGKATTGNWFASHKCTGKSALRYEIGVSILGGNLVWIQCPYPAGQFTNIKIFNNVLWQFLEPGKRVKANNNYVGATNKIKCPNNLCNPVKNKGMQSHVHLATRQSMGGLKLGGSSRRYITMMSGGTARSSKQLQ